MTTGDDYLIEHSNLGDLDFIYYLFDEAIIYQKKMGYPVWVGYDKELLQRDIEQGLQFKIVIKGRIAYLFSLAFTDEIVWRERDNHDAIYIHRLVVNPNSRGQKHFTKVMDWVIPYAQNKKIPFLRMDTWADNPSLENYYCSFGFQVVDFFTTPNTEDLPIQQRNNKVVLLEYRI